MCDACGACVVKPAAPSPVSRQFRSAVRYVLTARTWQLWHIFPGPRREGPRRNDPSPNRLLVRFRPPPRCGTAVRCVGGGVRQGAHRRCGGGRYGAVRGDRRTATPSQGPAVRAPSLYQGSHVWGRPVDRASEHPGAFLPREGAAGRAVADAEGVEAGVVGSHAPGEVLVVAVEPGRATVTRRPRRRQPAAERPGSRGAADCPWPRSRRWPECPGHARPDRP